MRRTQQAACWTFRLSHSGQFAAGTSKRFGTSADRPSVCWWVHSDAGFRHAATCSLCNCNVNFFELSLESQAIALKSLLCVERERERERAIEFPALLSPPQIEGKKQVPTCQPCGPTSRWNSINSHSRELYSRIVRLSLWRLRIFGWRVFRWRTARTGCTSPPSRDGIRSKDSIRLRDSVFD